MDTYQENPLEKYIQKSELVIINDDLRLRLSKQLLKKYQQGLYDNGIAMMIDNIAQVKALGFRYPANAKPIFYIYVVPDDNFRELLEYPSSRTAKGGSKPVRSYDLDGFIAAYGISSNKLESEKKSNFMQVVESIHELAHLIHDMFFYDERFLEEGFSEALPLYVMDYEATFDEHRELLKTLTEEQIFSAQQLIKLSEDGKFNQPPLIEGRSCAFDPSYISAYLFVRGCLEKLAEKYNLSKVQAAQKFLEIIKFSTCMRQFLVFDIAKAIDMPKEELLHGKKMQLDVIKRL
jgi:hypothetical protein